MAKKRANRDDELQASTQQNNHGLVSASASMEVTQHSGPIPDPQTLGLYGEIQPDLPNRIMAMAEDQLKHRHWMEKNAMTSDSRRAYAGIIAGTLFSLARCVQLTN